MADERGFEATAPVEVPVCSVCRRKRDPLSPEHPMDRYDYSAVQVITNSALGWYSGYDGEVCPEDMTKMIRNQ